MKILCNLYPIDNLSIIHAKGTSLTLFYFNQAKRP